MDKEDVCICMCTYTYTHTHTHTHVYETLAIQRIRSCHLQQPWMDLQCMLSEISQTNTNTVCYHLYVESKK